MTSLEQAAIAAIVKRLVFQINEAATYTIDFDDPAEVKITLYLNEIYCPGMLDFALRVLTDRIADYRSIGACTVQRGIDCNVSLSFMERGGE